MTNTELKKTFQVTGLTARDFMRWAAEKGATVHDATVSRHLAGTQGITAPWKIAYICFFSEQKAHATSGGGTTKP